MPIQLFVSRTLKTLLVLLGTLGSARLSAGDDLQQPSDIFRSLFYSLAKEQYADADIQRLIFQPHDAFLKAQPLTTEGEAAFRIRSDAWSPVTPSELYEKGRKTPFVLQDSPEASLDRRAITIVIIPGIFGEFITHSPFDEVLARQDSIYTKAWRAALEKKPTKDEVYDLEALGTVEKDLGELTRVASLDSPSGQDRIRVIYLKPLLGSLETLGTLEDSSIVYLRRLNKIRSVIGPLDNLYLMGYSRGLNVALDLLSRAEADEGKYPWFGELKGVVSLGGTLFGSPLADAAFRPGKPTCAALERLNQLASELVTLPAEADVGEQVAAVASNAAAWASAGADLLRVGASLETPEGLAMENPKADSLNIGAFGELFKTVIYDKFKITEGSEFNPNVQRFQRLMREITEGIKSITLAESLAWQSSHTIPAHLKYFVIQGTMADPADAKSGVSDLAQDSVSFNTKTIDYGALRTSYYDYYLDTGIALNDSQVSPDRTLFWPELHQNLNAKQKPYDAHLLALLGGDHWGMSFPVAIETRNEEVSPFPRTLLLRTLGAYLAYDLDEHER